MYIKELYLKVLSEDELNSAEVSFIKDNINLFLAQQTTGIFIHELDILDFGDYYKIDINCSIINGMKLEEIDNLGIEILI